MKISEKFPLTGSASIMEQVGLKHLDEHIQENVEDLVSFALQAAPQVYEGHESAPLDEKVAAAIMAGFYMGWDMRGEVE